MEVLWKYMLKFWEVPVQGNREPTFDHLHMSRNKCREGIDREEGIKEEAHIGIDSAEAARNGKTGSE